MQATLQALRDRFEAAGQGHVLAHWAELSDAERSELTAALESIHLDLVAQHAALLGQAEHHGPAPALEPPQLHTSPPTGATLERAAEAMLHGSQALREGRVGYLLVAGGQGSRLGFDGPKGKFPVGPLTRKSLFGWHAARIQAANHRYGRSAPWFVMTSATNDAETRAYFEEQKFFGLDPERVHFFQQNMVPALDAKGRIVMASRSQPFMAPNGHGGTLDALHSSGLLAKAAAAGVETFSYFQVDNPLARPADPLFLGLHLLEGAQMSSKVVAKSGPMEKVGVLGKIDGVLGCIEYSDLPADLRDATDEQGRLAFRAGNIAVHALQRSFVEELTRDGLDLPWHLARKNLAAIDGQGRPTETPGIKFETFIFDALGKSERSVTLEVQRELEFSPVKNAEGADSPQTCEAHLTSLFATWLQEAGVRVPTDDQGRPRVEVDPTFAEDATEFLARMPAAGQPLDGGLLFQ